MQWREYVVADPDVLAGKPVVAGTRLSMDFLLNLLSEGWTEQQILDNYPSLSSRSLPAVFAFAAECMWEDALFPIDQKTAG
jgi:uncharacterized protein (DUF433 family)